MTMTAQSIRSDRGAYGLSVTGIDDRGALRVRDVGSWPALRVENGVGPRPSGGAFITDQEASIPTPIAHLSLDRARRRLVVRSRGKLPDADLVHPCLWPAAAIFARWQGAESFHGGAFTDVSGGAWALLGERGAGKSSLLAALALAGHQVIADDLVVVDGRACFAGPRCIDLRPGTARMLCLSDRTSPVRSTRRRRLPLAPADGRFRLRGFVHLEWASRIETKELAPGESFGRLIDQRRVAALGADHQHLLDLAGLPALRFARPGASHQLQQSADALIDATSRYAE